MLLAGLNQCLGSEQYLQLLQRPFPFFMQRPADGCNLSDIFQQLWPLLFMRVEQFRDQLYDPTLMQPKLVIPLIGSSEFL